VWLHLTNGISESLLSLLPMWYTKPYWLFKIISKKYARPKSIFWKNMMKKEGSWCSLFFIFSVHKELSKFMKIRMKTLFPHLIRKETSIHAWLTNILIIGTWPIQFSVPIFHSRLWGRNHSQWYPKSLLESGIYWRHFHKIDKKNQYQYPCPLHRWRIPHSESWLNPKSISVRKNPFPELNLISIL